ncbi:MAG TPA: hypothetical protein VLF89_02095 [Candidatus Saccharimonadales bacterium]|nr:hypothetical protein [Candidatus Saccharimonadales bacterium]
MKKSVHTYIHSRLLFQLIIFGLISLIMMSIVGYDIMINNITFEIAFLGIGIGLLVGFAVGRMFAIKWHEDTEKVIIGMDKTSILIIIVYVVFRIFGNELLGQILHGNVLTAFTYCTIGGIMIGRFFSMTRSIRNILKKQKIL